LRRLERAIASAGYETLNLAYPSCSKPLADLVEVVHAEQDWIERHGGRTHIVTYSMGGLLARGYIARLRPPNLGRVVMLAPPNGGSEVADLLAKNFLYRLIFGPVGAELTTKSPQAAAQLLGPVDYPLGIIAGNRFIDPLGWLLIPGPNDGRVSVERTKVPGMTDHVTIPATHFAMMRNRLAIRHTLHFLEHGGSGEANAGYRRANNLGGAQNL
jgi:pimeloyl-ACP methyl ester carboxylesterase